MLYPFSIVYVLLNIDTYVLYGEYPNVNLECASIVKSEYPVNLRFMFREVLFVT